MLVAVHYMSELPDEFEIVVGLLLDKFLGDRLSHLNDCQLSYRTSAVQHHYAVKLEIFAKFPNENEEFIYRLKYPEPKRVGVPLGRDSEYT